MAGSYKDRVTVGYYMVILVHNLCCVQVISVCYFHTVQNAGKGGHDCLHVSSPKLLMASDG
jgi:hypothetical protein